ncbi:MAG: UDP-glucose/GDP-mannose dehydrogenase family protein [Methanomassiliicoccales archaeon]|nr:UDP-glucose/GDP-mannose dehydrogenase family protein [Methanomassiliicoccales archaeon]
MRISVIGTGYVGLVTGLCLAELGHQVTCIDIDEGKVDSINRGESPIFEMGTGELLGKHLASGEFRASSDPLDIAQSDITFVSVGTPSREDGSLDLTYLEKAARDVGEALGPKKGYHLVVVKSTVMPTTTERVILPILEKHSGKEAGKDFGLCMNPEFLREGMAIHDFFHPDRVVIGALDERSSRLLLSIYEGFDCPMMVVDLATAEMIKVASNAFLATKISFINEIGNICKAMGIDVREVAEGMGQDSRISPKFLRAGCGFGGSCFPKDVKGLAAEARKLGIEPVMLGALLEVNEGQPEILVQLLKRRMDIKGKTIAVLGLAFKPDTDDIRESRAIPLVQKLLESGATVLCHDPQASESFGKLFTTVKVYTSAEECVSNADAVVIVTEWSEYSNPSLYGDKLVIDGRGVVRTRNYEGICW